MIVWWERRKLQRQLNRALKRREVLDIELEDWSHISRHLPPDAEPLVSTSEGIIDKLLGEYGLLVKEIKELEFRLDRL